MFILFFWEIKNHKETIDISSIRTNSVSIIDYGVQGDGKTDDTIRFQQAINDSVQKDQFLIIPKGTYVVSPLKYRDSNSSDWWCLDIPSSAKLYFEPGAIIKLVDNAPEWTRVLVMSEVENVSLYGHVQVDGNAQTVTNGNEHMHGIFIFDSRNIHIESAHSYNSYGDNLFIGGTEENYSENINISFFKGVTAGRKNLVIHYVDNLHIGTAVLDNSKGGVGNQWSGENSLDLEPDAFRGINEFYQRIDNLSTYGMGNDFTVGREKNLAKQWKLDIGTFNVELMEGATEGLLSYAVTIEIDKLYVKSHKNNDDIGLKMVYAALWKIEEATFMEGNNYAISAKESDGQKPDLKIEKVTILRPNGGGLELWGANAEVEELEVTTKGTVLDIFSTSTHRVKVNNFLSIDSGEDEIIYISDYGYEPHIQINELQVIDEREHKVNRIVYLNTQNAVDGLEVNQLQNKQNLRKVGYGESVLRKDSPFLKEINQ